MTTNSLFDRARVAVKMHDNQEPTRAGEAYSGFGVNKDLPYAEREMLTIAAHMVDPTIVPSQSMMNYYLNFTQRFDSFPTHALNAKLDHLQKTLPKYVQREENGDITFTAPTDGSYPLDFIVRTALPHPTPIKMTYQLPEGKEYEAGDKSMHHGTVSYEQLIDLLDRAELTNNFEAQTELHSAHCIKATVGAEYADALKQTLGIDVGGKAR